MKLSELEPGTKIPEGVTIEPEDDEYLPECMIGCPEKEYLNSIARLSMLSNDNSWRANFISVISILIALGALSVTIWQLCL